MEEKMEEKTIQYYITAQSMNLKQIVEDYSRYVFIIIKNMTKDMIKDEDIEELISDVFFAVWKNRESIKKDAPLKPYIAGISKNVVKNKLRSLKNVNMVSDEEEWDFESGISLESEVETREKVGIISEELNKLGPDRKIFIMFYSYGKKTREIAEILGLTEFNVSTKLHRIKKKIKKVLEDRGY